MHNCNTKIQFIIHPLYHKMHHCMSLYIWISKVTVLWILHKGLNVLEFNNNLLHDYLNVSFQNVIFKSLERFLKLINLLFFQKRIMYVCTWLNQFSKQTVFRLSLNASCLWGFVLILDIEYYNMHCLIRFGKKKLKCIKPMLKICPFPFSEIYLFYIIEESIII